MTDTTDCPDGTGHGLIWDTAATLFHRDCDMAVRDGNVTWRHRLLDVTYAATAAADPAALRAALTDIHAVVGHWIHALDERTTNGRQ